MRCTSRKTQSELGRAVALKIVPAEVARDKDRLQRFTQEARTVSNLNHPNILTVYEFGQTDSGSFIATEYIDGVTLREYLSGRRLKLIDILDLAIQIVAALNAAHEAGVTHRDLKPENVMVRRDQIVKVLDFGLAKLAAPLPDLQIDSEAGTKVFVQTEPGLVMGTVSYMSPEQSIGTGIDQRTDIWSFGVLLYEMLAGCVPFQGKDIHRQIIAIQESEPAPLATLVEGVPDRLEEIVTKCLAKNKDERYQTAKDLLIDLRNLRRKLDVDAEIERTVAPAFRSTSAGASHASTEGSPPQKFGVPPSGGIASSPQTLPPEGGTPNTYATSSAEYVVTGIKQHKLAVAAITLALVVGAVALVAFILRGRTANAAIKSIAVMPFVNEGGNADLEYLSDGMTDTLISSLSQLPNLSVKARSSVFRYKGKEKEKDPQTIGKELNVQAILNGRVAQRGDQLTLTLELVDVQTENVIWSEQYNRKQSELVSLQSEIARDVSSKLKLKLSGADEQKLNKVYTTNPDAYQLYLKGRFYWNKLTPKDLRQSLEFYQQAIDKDPAFALAYVGISDTYMVLGIPDVMLGVIPPQESVRKARNAADKALEIDPTLAEAYASRAHVKWKERDWAGADEDFKHSIELNGNYSNAHRFYAIYLVSMGRSEEAVREVRRSEELEPLSVSVKAHVAFIFYFARRYDEAVDAGKKAVELDAMSPVAHQRLGSAYEQKGMFPEAIAEFQKAVDGSNRVQLAVTSLAHAFALAGKRAEAEKLLAELRERSGSEYVSSYLIAEIYVALGEKEAAFKSLDKAYDERSIDLVLVKVDPRLDQLRDDPRFKDVLKRLNLPE